ncbi:hypothetical protein [Brevundimonas lutea]|uniref:hypothetical protein n=1 Tax=Brevundimonas lutea TaxID=2293980 RepID=UPI000F0182F2|nr:hypothetical protein [Brevundimonas lutea]
MKKLLALAAAAITLATAGSAAAQVVSTINYTLAPGDSLTNDHHFDTGQPCNIHSGVGDTLFETQTMTVSVGGSYDVTDLFVPDDASLGIYSGAFDTNNPTVGCVATVDDGLTVALPAGVYTVVLSSLNSPGDGDYGYAFDGPAAVTFSAAAATVPTLTEWAMIILAMGLGGVALVYARRRGLIPG